MVSEEKSFEVNITGLEMSDEERPLNRMLLHGLDDDTVDYN